MERVRVGQFSVCNSRIDRALKEVVCLYLLASLRAFFRLSFSLWFIFRRVILFGISLY